MANSDQEIIDNLRFVCADLPRIRHARWQYFVIEALELIQRQADAIERLTPKPMTLERAVEVFNERDYSGEARWYIHSGLVWGCSVSGFFRPIEAIYIAQGLEREQEAARA